MQLNYKVFGEACLPGRQGFPVIILHGLLGSMDNWQTIAKKLSENFQVCIIDQRNHGRSPHSDEFSYKLLSDDLAEFVENQRIKKVYLIGHSMGGKAAMKFALEYSERVEKLIVVDVSPAKYEDGHSDVFNALFAADAEHAASREAVEKVLRDKLNNDETTVQFLMKGLQRSDQGQTGFTWKFNLESLFMNYKNIQEAIHSPTSFKKETLFIKGEKSNYISSENYKAITELFPNNQLTEIKGAGHWVHADMPVEFVHEVMKFLI